MKPEQRARAWMHSLGLHAPLWGEEDVKLFMREETAVDQVAAEKDLDQIATQKDLDELSSCDPSAAAAIQKIEQDLTYRMPNSDRPLSHIVLPRAHAQCLLQAVQATNSSLTFAEYSTQALTTAIYPGSTTIDALSYLALKLAGEAGEVGQKIAKAIRDNANIIDETRRLALLDECGDCLWYLNALASELNSGLTEVAQRNLTKIKDRQMRGVQGGDGDNR
jgi:NTP pyrophosphatase (non-canonical NTP hydrolase)